MTTVSQINPEVVYRETRTIEDEDIGHTTQVYELLLENGPIISVVLGKPKYTYSHKSIVYFPIYAVHGSKVRSQIGVFEVESSKLLKIYSQSEVDVEQLNRPVFYSFATVEYLGKLGADPNLFVQPHIPSSSDEPEPEPIQPILGDVMEEDHLQLHAHESRLSKTKSATQSVVDEGIFEDIDGFKMPDLLPEETKEDADAGRKEYKKSERNAWIEKFMCSNKYRIHEVENNGDCLFACVREAYAEIGKKTTVAKLRALIANEMTEGIFDTYRAIYLGFAEQINTLNRELKTIEKTLKEYKSRIKKNNDATAGDTKILIEQSNALMNEHKMLERQIMETQDFQENYVGEIKHIDTLEKMRQYIQTPSFWADGWTISTLERLLNIKFIIFSESAFNPDGKSDSCAADLAGVITCGEISPEIDATKSFSPDHYIMVSYNGNHYRPISYKDHKILTFREIPYDVKILILNLCLSHLSGAFYLIPDFRNLKTRFAIDEDEGVPDDYSESPGAGELYDNQTTFVFYSKSDKSVKPGKADGEKILPENVPKYAPLGSKRYLDWRKKLDDEWDKTPISIDGHMWTSVEHYKQGVRFKKTHPDVYLMFSLDTDPNSELATSVKSAKAFKGILQPAEVSKEPEVEGAKKKKKTDQKVKVIAPDMDFDEKREQEERMTALKAKFLNNEDMRGVLQMTQTALLLHKEKSGDPPTMDALLMKVRKMIK